MGADESPPAHLKTIAQLLALLNSSPDTPASLEADLQRQRAANEQVVLDSLLTNWTTEVGNERRLRKAFGWGLFSLFVVESLGAMWILLQIGYHHLGLSRWIASIFFAAVFTQVALLLRVVVHYLFSRTPDQLLAAYIDGMLKRQ
jgi:hypothetical protein